MAMDQDPLQNVQLAYDELGIRDRLVADEDVVVAYHNEQSKLHVSAQNNPTPENKIDPKAAVEIVANTRQSRFLRFILAITQHLNDENVNILTSSFIGTDQPKIQGPITTIEPEHMEIEHSAWGMLGGSSDNDVDGMGTREESSASSYSPSSVESSAEAECIPPGVDAANDDANIYSDDDSDFTEEEAAAYMAVDGTTKRGVWRCDLCNVALLDGRCPGGHGLQRCGICAWELEDGVCPKCPSACEVCKPLSTGRCGNCETVEESEDEEEDLIMYNLDGVWRCPDCEWEVEAENANDGNCHCKNDLGEAHYIDLSECLDYEPADSCSSDDDSSDEGLDSEEEQFIDDAEIATGGEVDHIIVTKNLVDVLPGGRYAHCAIINIILEDTRAAEAARDKENVERASDPGGVEVIQESEPTSTKDVSSPMLVFRGKLGPKHIIVVKLILDRASREQCSRSSVVRSELRRRSRHQRAIKQGFELFIIKLSRYVYVSGTAHPIQQKRYDNHGSLSIVLGCLATMLFGAQKSRDEMSKAWACELSISNWYQ